MFEIQKMGNMDPEVEAPVIGYSNSVMFLRMGH